MTPDSETLGKLAAWTGLGLSFLVVFAITLST